LQDLGLIAIFLMSKAAQGFVLKRTLGTPQSETRGERRSLKKGPFLDGNYFPFKDQS
jgi:hypothetical protein